MFDREMPAIEEYTKFFAHCGNERFRMEASPSYLYGKEKIAETIKTELGDVKIIMILRDPTDRLVSYFSRAVSESGLPADIDFHEYLTMSEGKLHSNEHNVYSRGIREGIYINYIRPWQKVFNQDLKIVFFDDLKSNAFDLVVRIGGWLGLDPVSFDPRDFTVENETFHYRYRGLHRYLKRIYMKSEAFWRRHHQLKLRIRNIYNLINADADRKLQTIDAAALSKARAIYAPYNRQLKAFLEENNYESLPEWLG